MKLASRAFVLVLILGYAAFLRLHRLEALPPALFMDEGMDGCNALEILETHRVKAFYPEDSGREGLYIAAAAPFIHHLGTKAWVVRLPAVIFGLLTVPGVYLLAARLFSPGPALLAMFFVASSFWHLVFSREAFRAILVPCFLVYALYLLFAGLDRIRTGRSGTGWLLAAGFIYGLGFYTYPSYRITPLICAVPLIFYFFEARRKNRLTDYAKGTGAFLLASAATMIPLARAFLYDPSFSVRLHEVSVFSFPHPAQTLALNILKTGAMVFVHGDGNLRHNVPWRPEVFWPVAILFAIAWIRGAFLLARKRNAVDPRERFALFLLIAWTLFGSVPVVLSGEAIPHALRSSILIPPVFILAGLAGWRLYQALAPMLPPMVLRGAVAAALLAIAYEPYNTYFKIWASQPGLGLAFNSNVMEIAEAIQTLPRGSKKLVVSMNSAPRMENGIPLELTTVAYLTRTYSHASQVAANTTYRAVGVADHKSCEDLANEAPGTHVFCFDWSEHSAHYFR